MKLTRNTATKIHFILDQIIPPILRDSKFFMYLPFRIIYGNKAKIFFNFKDRAPFMTEEEFSRVYEDIDKVLIEREIELNNDCIEEILKNTGGESVLEVGCGKAWLSNKIEELGYKVTAVDVYINNEIKLRYPKITFKNGNVEHLPFEDSSFDTVVCTHTLEHVQNLTQSIAELRRVCKKRLIIVVPKQRPYRYTFDLHIHFFPYIHSFLLAIGAREKNGYKVIGNDIFYIEDYKS